MFLFYLFSGWRFLLHCCPWVGRFSSFGCHLDLTTSNVVVSNKKNKPGCGPVFFASAGRFFPKKGPKKCKFPASKTAFFGAEMLIFSRSARITLIQCWRVVFYFSSCLYWIYSYLSSNGF